MSRPLVSIVTPTLNQGRFIEQTIRSIEAQTYAHYEHIIVDGGSSDETLEILRRHEGTYPMRWTSGPDEGMYDAINKGMRQAKGEILAYLNSDDLYFPWTLEVVVEAFGRDREADLIVGDCLRLDSDSGYLLFQPPPYRDWLVRTGYLAQPAVFWRRSVADDLGEFDADLRYVADCEFWMRALQHHRLTQVHEFLAVDTIQPGALRSELGEAVVAETEVVRARFTDLHGPGHRARSLLNRIWGALWRRAYWLQFLVRQGAGTRARGSWAHWLAETQPRISTRDAILAQVPVIGDRFAWRALRSGGRPDA